MKALGILRVVLFTFALCVGLCCERVFGQDVGADIGGGAGIFRAKNPETKKKATTKPVGNTSKPTNRATHPTAAGVEERIEDLLDAGNSARDARKFSNAEDAYQGVL